MWKRIKPEDGFQYRLIQDDEREIKQLVLPNSLKVLVLKAMDDQAGHQVSEKTNALG